MKLLHNIIRYYVPVAMLLVFCWFIIITPDEPATFIERLLFGLYFYTMLFLSIGGESVADFVCEKIENHWRL